MDKRAVIKQLESLRDHCQSMIDFLKEMVLNKSEHMRLHWRLAREKGVI